MLTPGVGGAQGAESRWHIAPCHSHTTTRWRLELLRARAEPPQDWDLSQAEAGRGFTLARRKAGAEAGADMRTKAEAAATLFTRK